MPNGDYVSSPGLTREDAFDAGALAYPSASITLAVAKPGAREFCQATHLMCNVRRRLQTQAVGFGHLALVAAFLKQSEFAEPTAMRAELSQAATTTVQVTIRRRYNNVTQSE